MDKTESERLMRAILDIGELLFMNGGEANRVEDTVTRIFKAYGAEKADVFCIVSNLIVTVQFSDGTRLTQTRRMKGRGSDLGCVDELNALSRHVCSKPVPVEDLERQSI